MAEGLLEGVLGGEEERAEADALEKADVGAVAFAAAVAAGEAGRDPGVARATEVFLNAQTRLLDTQREELLEQRALRLHHLKSLRREGGLRQFGLSLRNGMQVFVAVVATVIGLGLVTMLADAFTSRSVVVEAFKAPPALAGRGVTGEVVAADVLDNLQKFQAATRSASKSLQTRGAWASDIKIEVPETGVSIGEISRLLHGRFGHDLHIAGDLIQTETGGLALTVRGDGVPADTFTGGAGDLEGLTRRAAEYIYGRSQPFRYAVYLLNAARFPEALAFLEDAYPRARSDDERSAFANTWASAYTAQNMTAEAIGKYRLAMSLAKPQSTRWWKIWGNLVGVVSAQDGEEAGWREARALLDAAVAAPTDRKPVSGTMSNPAQLTWDLPLLLKVSLEDARANGGAGTQSSIEGPMIADTYAWLHNWADAARWMAASDPKDPTTKAEVLLQQGYAALDRGDVVAAVGPLEAFYKAWEGDPNLQYSFNFNPCLTAFAVGTTGRMKQAEAIFKRVGEWSYCRALQGDMLVHAGDVAGAQRVWAESMKAAPDLPAVPLHRGLFELGRGDLRAAERDIAYASAKAPHWADPLKAWGDVLAREGRWKAALAKYKEALKYAPAWAGLRQASDAAARRAS